MSKQKYIRLDLPSPIAAYDYVELLSEREEWTNDDPWVTVWLDIEKVIFFTKTGGQSWPKAPQHWENGKLDYFIDAWDPNRVSTIGALADMPRISYFYEEPKRLPVRKSWWQMLKRLLGVQVADELLYVPGFAYVVFGNGRHRTEFLRYNGVLVMPFETRKSHAPKLFDLCNSACSDHLT